MGFHLKNRKIKNEAKNSTIILKSINSHDNTIPVEPNNAKQRIEYAEDAIKPTDTPFRLFNTSSATIEVLKY